MENAVSFVQIRVIEERVGLQTPNGLVGVSDLAQGKSVTR